MDQISQLPFRKTSKNHATFNLYNKETLPCLFFWISSIILAVDFPNFRLFPNLKRYCICGKNIERDTALNVTIPL